MINIIKELGAAVDAGIYCRAKAIRQLVQEGFDVASADRLLKNWQLARSAYGRSSGERLDALLEFMDSVE